MASRFFVGGGNGNWSSTTNWSATDGGASGASFPLVTDDVFLTAASGANNLTVNVASAALSINCTGFTGTLTMTNTLTTSGNITLASGMTIAGAGGLLCGATATLVSNGKAWPNALTLFGSATQTLNDAWTVGNLIVGSTNGSGMQNTGINGNSITINGNLSLACNAAGGIFGTTEFVIVGNCTISVASSSTGGMRNKLTINTAGTVTFPVGNTFRYDTGELKYVAGTVVTTGSTIECNAATSLNTGSIVWNNLKLLLAGTYTLLTDVYVSGTLTIGSSATNSTINGAFSLVTSGPVLVNNAGGTLGGTATLKVTGTQTLTRTNGIGVFGMLMVIDSPGTVTFVNEWNIKLGKMICISGTVVTDADTWTEFGGGGSAESSHVFIG